jgi:hypothetical protein
MAVRAQRVSAAYARIEALIADDFAVILDGGNPTELGAGARRPTARLQPRPLGPRALHDPPYSVVDVHPPPGRQRRPESKRGPEPNLMVVSRQLNLNGWGVVRSGEKAQHVTQRVPEGDLVLTKEAAKT